MSYHFFKQRGIFIPPHPPPPKKALKDAKTAWKYDLRSENSYQTTLI